MIELAQVGKAYQSQSGMSRTGIVHAVGQVDLHIAEGEFVSIVGPSGCGKSTLLNMIAGFLPPTTGSIRVAGQPVQGRVPPALGYIFQKDTLLPWYSVRKNVALGLRFQGVPAQRIAPRVAELLELGHLSGFADAYPHQLSGGMRRRVALLMSLAVEPRILLLDEPFGALDTHTKTHLHRELMEIWRKLGQTIVMVTHDLDEAITLSDRVVVLSGPPSRVLRDERIDIPHPRDVFALRETPQFTAHVQSLWSVLGQQFRVAA
ncbi:ABC transporter ATP-binding protein [Bordetella genomosp. 13]|uniref:ABC transporter ATP-binding protein n=1 Tax=Bordetella genomosp. 13 TaxID=463040 RepID=A0A1W6Z6X8_9BORD|nr:ABC transporter ATP-binding protein [Bordetella genomosp. 13]ARP93012.1 ABC transporter ATP-binding protein [Bordetella genomosp. 13]